MAGERAVDKLKAEIRARDVSDGWGGGGSEREPVGRGTRNEADA